MFDPITPLHIAIAYSVGIMAGRIMRSDPVWTLVSAAAGGLVMYLVAGGEIHL